MKKSEVDKIIYSEFSRILIPAEFIALKNECKFRRPTPFGFQEIGYPVSDYNPMFRFTFYVCIRFNAVEDILNRLLARPEEYWGVSRSVTLNLGFFVGENLSFEVHDIFEIETAFVEVKKILLSNVFPMLNECNNLPALERLLNNKIIVSPLESEANAGVVAAALCRKNDFTEIVSRYRYAMSGYIEPIRLRFEMVVSHLTKTFFDEGHAHDGPIFRPD